MRWLYSFSIFLYKNLVFLFSLWGKKAKKKHYGSTHWEDDLRIFANKNPNPIWFHASSLGEFEQGRPIIEKIKKEKPEVKILLSFFSPSGYEMQKNYQHTDLVCYLPFDLPKDCRKFIQIAKPQLVVFIKYEYWYNLMNELHKAKIPFFYLSVIFRNDDYFFKAWGKWFLKHLKFAEHFFVQNQKSKEILQKNGIERVSISGDTRIERVKQIAKNPIPNAILEQFKNQKQLLIAGSTWLKDEEIVLAAIKKNKNKDTKFLVAPHQINEKQIQKLENRIQEPVVRFTKVLRDSEDLQKARILILDTIGMLSNAYQYADWAYIGGGFDQGIHNTLEAAAFGVPILFGPKYKKFIEAEELIQLGAAQSSKNPKELAEKIVGWINDTEESKIAGNKAYQYIWNEKTSKYLDEVSLKLINTINKRL